MPTFCPLMDRHFATIQERLKADPALSKVHLVSVSFDPVTDTPPVLKKHAPEARRRPGALDVPDRRPRRDRPVRVALRRARSPATMNDPRDITHNLRTAIIDRQGKLVKTYTGNEWTPDQVLADLDSRANRLRPPRETPTVSAARAPADRPPAHAARGSALPESAAVQHRTAARRRHAAQLPRRRPARRARTASRPRSSPPSSSSSTAIRRWS